MHVFYLNPVDNFSHNFNSFVCLQRSREPYFSEGLTNNTCKIKVREYYLFRGLAINYFLGFRSFSNITKQVCLLSK